MNKTDYLLIVNLARSYLSDGWVELYPNQDKLKSVRECIIKAIDTVSEGSTKEAGRNLINILNNRLQGMSLHKWLVNVAHWPESDLTDRKVQVYRHKWLNEIEQEIKDGKIK